MVFDLLSTVTVYQRVDGMDSVCTPVAGDVCKRKVAYGQELVGKAVSVGAGCSV